MILLITPNRALKAIYTGLQTRGSKANLLPLLPACYGDYTTYSNNDNPFEVFRNIMALHIYSFKVFGNDRPAYLSAVRELRQIPVNDRDIKYYSAALIPRMDIIESIRVLNSLYVNSPIKEIDPIPFIWLNNLTSLLEGSFLSHAKDLGRCQF